MKSSRDEATVLRTHKLGEADRIITLLTAEHGQVRAVAKGVPVVCGTGCKKETGAQILQNCDGAVVGTTFKKDGVFENRVDAQRVKAFMDTVKQMRGNV